MKIRNPKYPFKQCVPWENCPTCFEDFSLTPCTNCGNGFEDEYIEVPSKLEQLTTRIAELEEEKKELQALLDFDNVRLDQIEDELEDVEYLGPFVEGIKVLKTQLAAEQLNNKRLRDGVTAVNELINDSYGVAGLHLNGDIATWEELRTGGRFEEWLCLFDETLSIPASTEALDAYVKQKIKEYY